MTFDGTCERGGVQRAPQEIEEGSPAARDEGHALRVLSTPKMAIGRQKLGWHFLLRR
jgi:hypothetical protein